MQLTFRFRPIGLIFLFSEPNRPECLPLDLIIRFGVIVLSGNDTSVAKRIRNLFDIPVLLIYHRSEGGAHLMGRDLIMSTGWKSDFYILIKHFLNAPDSHSFVALGKKECLFVFRWKIFAARVIQIIKKSVFNLFILHIHSIPAVTFSRDMDGIIVEIQVRDIRGRILREFFQTGKVLINRSEAVQFPFMTALVIYPVLPLLMINFQIFSSGSSAVNYNR